MMAFFFFFTALSITDLKVYFFLGETMKREKEREITDTADTSKPEREETQQHKQHREQASRMCRGTTHTHYTLGPLPALKGESSRPGTDCGSFARKAHK